jgi:hypothetical protein
LVILYHKASTMPAGNLSVFVFAKTARLKGLELSASVETN